MLWVWVFALGAAVGSFINVCIARLPRKMSLVRPSSHCFACGRPIRFYDNIPLVSYAILRGRCRRCRARISPRYPVVEALSGLMFVALFRTFGLGVEFWIYAIFFSALLVVVFVDLDTLTIPDVITLPGIAAGVLASLLLPRLSLLQSLLGIVAGGGVLLLVSFGYQIVRQREGLGGGDIKLLAMIGAFTGIPGVGFTLLASSLSGALVGMLLMVRQKSGGATLIPYGPFLAMGAMTYVLWGPAVFHWYLNILGR